MPTITPLTSTYNASKAFLDLLPDDLEAHIVQNDDPAWGQAPSFDDDAVEYLAEAMQSVIAHIIASLINAGSERDAINEDEALHDALVRVLKDW